MDNRSNYLVFFFNLSLYFFQFLSGPDNSLTNEQTQNLARERRRTFDSRSSKTEMRTFKTLSGCALTEMDPKEINELSREELLDLAFRGRAVLSDIATYMEATSATEMENFKRIVDFLSLQPQDIAALTDNMLKKLVTLCQVIISLSPFKPGCRFCTLPDEYILHVLLEWLTIEDQARFDMALLNHMDRRAHLHLLRDTEHGGVLSVSRSRKGTYKFDSGVCEWLESRNVFMRALKFRDVERDIPAGLLARTGKQLLEIDLSGCSRISDAEFVSLTSRCPRLQSVNLMSCANITDATAVSLSQHCPRLHTIDFYCTKISDAGLASF